ncbi:hypothetical protein GTS_37280 [Gandjariella thermophila]|uniref:Uncharacterized protein n=2 Tax=Gandjariella thermophila TaxID=1931992 RepID=A0A4D4J5W0_9PSEU|nr:hypothetical protein GTS_37280 [Gandjariella thermophila]
MPANASEAGVRPTLRWWLLGGLLLGVASVGIGVWAVQLSYDVVRERERTCNGRIPVPHTAFALGWTAVALAAAALGTALVAHALRRQGDRITASILALPLMGGGVVATVAAALTRAWILALAGVVAVTSGIAFTFVRRGRTTELSTASRRGSGALIGIEIAGAILATLLTLFLLTRVYSDAPTHAHICSG